MRQLLFLHFGPGRGGRSGSCGGSGPGGAAARRIVRTRAGGAGTALVVQLVVRVNFGRSAARRAVRFERVTGATHSAAGLLVFQPIFELSHASMYEKTLSNC